MAVIKQALISVSDKSGIVEFAKDLRQFGVTIISTGGTANLLAQSRVDVIEVGDYTGFPEMLDGRVKTLHPKIHAGILTRRDNPDHMQTVSKAKIPPIDMVVVNLYPFRETVATPGCTLDEAVENIDIGGPTLVRGAAKNFRYVAVVTDPRDYQELIREMQSANGAIGLQSRYKLAQKAFSHVAAYDGAISNYLTGTALSGESAEFPQQLNLSYSKVQDLRYGENPHQRAALYRDLSAVPGSLSRYTQLQGKELSYNNIADADAAWECAKTFEQPACVIVKHANPCGVAVAANAPQAYKSAFATDPTSAFGGIIAFNRELDAQCAAAVIQQFVEVVIAPSITPDAIPILTKKANIRVLQVALEKGENAQDFKRIGGGLLVQTPDHLNVVASQLKVVTKKQPTPQQLADLMFAWRVAKFVKSNAIVFANDGQTLGVGAGQMSRVDSARIASIKAQHAGLSLRGSVAASDAFFPFRDGVDMVVQAGARAVIQPGGSMRDDEVIDAANQHEIAMVFTGVRHFRH